MLHLTKYNKNSFFSYIIFYKVKRKIFNIFYDYICSLYVSTFLIFFKSMVRVEIAKAFHCMIARRGAKIKLKNKISSCLYLASTNLVLYFLIWARSTHNYKFKRGCVYRSIKQTNLTIARNSINLAFFLQNGLFWTTRLEFLPLLHFLRKTRQE